MAPTPTKAACEATWRQVCAWVLGRQGLVGPRAAPEPGGLADAVSTAGCIQAQHLPSARAALSLRVAAPLSAGALDLALRPAGTLLRTWLMRGTMHFVTPTEWPEYLTAVAPVWKDWHRARLARQGLSTSAQARLLDRYRAVFEREDRPLTRKELGEILSRETGQAVTVSGWGGPVRLLCYRGELVCGPPAGNQVTFTLARRQVGALSLPRFPSPEAALDAVLTRYLQAFGPATAADFRHWTGLPASVVRPAWQRAVDSGRLAGVAVRESPRKQHFMLAEDLPAFADLCTGGGRGSSAAAGGGDGAGWPEPLFLPRFENLLLAYADKERLIDRAHVGLVFQPVANVAATILDRGRVVGTWRAAGPGQARRVVVQLFPGEDSRPAFDRVAAAARRLEERGLT